MRKMTEIARTQPWLARREWVEKRIPHSHLRDGIMLLAFALLWNLICAPALYFAMTGGAPPAVRWIVVAFAILGVLFLIGGARAAATGARAASS